MTEKRHGSQKPRIDQFNDGYVELGLNTIDLIEAYGVKLLNWQKLVLSRWMATSKDGKWTNSNCGLVVPRQNGKSELFIARIIGGMILLGEHLAFTAQSVDTANTIKNRVFKFFFNAKPEIRNLLTSEFDKEPKSFDYIELRNGGRCVFSTRTRSAGLGTTNDVLLIDEAQEYTDAQEEALRPTISSAPTQNAQVIMAGTPPPSGSAGTVFKRTRTNVLKGKAETWCWQEWSVPTITDNKDRDAWYATNPSLGYFMDEKAIAGESVSMAQDSFNKMRLGWFQGVDSQRIISDEDWNKLKVTEVKLPDNPDLVYAIKFAPDRSSVSLAVGVCMGNKIHVEIVKRKSLSSGISWIVKWLLDKPRSRYRNCNKIIIDGAAGTQLLVEELIRSDKRIKKKLLTPNAREAGAAYASFIEAIKDETVTHYDQPVLNSSIRCVKRRDIGRDGMFGFASINPAVQSDAAEAVAYAYFGSKKYKKSNKKSHRQTISYI